MATKNFNLSEDIESILKDMKRLPDYTVGGPNSPGWEDSAEISRDGTQLSFTYLPFDMVSQFFQQKTIFTGPRTTERPGQYKTLTSSIYTKKCTNGNFTFGVSEPVPHQSYELVGCQHIEKDVMSWRNENLQQHTKKLYVKVSTGTFDIKGLDQYVPDNPNFVVCNPLGTSVVVFDGVEPGQTKRNIFMSILDKTFTSVFMINLSQWNINTPDKEEAQPFYYDGKLYFSRNYEEILEADLATGSVRSILKLKNRNRILGLGEPSRDVNGNFYFVVIFKMDTYNDCDICRGKF